MLKYIFSWFVKSDDADSPLSLDEAYKVVADCENDPEETRTVVEDKVIEKDLDAYEVHTKIGRVTQIHDDICKIDDTYDYKTDEGNLSVGSKVSFQLINSSGELRVVNLHLLENDWNVSDTGKQKWYERTFICTVTEREGRILTLSPGKIKINLNNVSSEFVPIKGDWVQLDVKCQIDENVADLSGKIIEINKIAPLRAQIKLAHVTNWNSEFKEGVVDRNVFFNKDVLYCGYIPAQGDKVVAEIIESNQGSCTWRALKIVPDYLHSKEKKDVQYNLHTEDFKQSCDFLSITDNISLTFTKLGEAKMFNFVLESQEEIQLICIEFPRVNGQCTLDSSIDHQLIKAGQCLTIRCKCSARNIGESRELVIFHFDKFKMARWVAVVVADQTSRSENKNRRKSANKSIIPRIEKEIIRGQKIKSTPRFHQVRIPDFPVPERLLKLITKFKGEQSITSNILRSELEKMKPCLITPLNYMNYEDRFHTLLHLEEIFTMLQMHNYDQERACFVKSGEYLLLEIENLGERRPSVIMGDRVIARNIYDTNCADYEGFIHKTSKNHLHIKFSPLFHDAYNGEDYSVFIIASRVTYRRKHYAINLAVRNLGKDWLFPTQVTEKLPQLEFVIDPQEDHLSSSNEDDEQKTSHNLIGKQRLMNKIRRFQEGYEEDSAVRKLEWYNKSLNFYQKEAVRNIILGVCRPLPYIIFGPPGTGKTITIVETVLQILRLMPHSRLLVAAPSNSAADLLALRLIDSGVLKPGDLIRLVAISAIPSIPPRLAPFCATANVERQGTETSLPEVTANGLVLGYSSSVLGRHRITVTTCSSAGLLHNMGFSKGHFTHIIVDEAGQTSEPSVLIPLAFLDISSGQAILAGDPMQLGPVVLSKLAGEFGLEESFLERLTSRFPYVRDSQGFVESSGYDPRLITKLIYNYRSLPDLLKLASDLFYNNDLRPTISDVDSKEIAMLQQLREILPVTKDGKIASIVFHNVIGENFQSEDSPSWYNPHEASQVFYYLNELYRLGMKENDVGIITPYKAQLKQIMELFREAEFDIPKIGTVEEFQGQEYNIIIVSTVRSQKKHVSADIKYTMGFISNPRRLNVSITRAKALLIIVGNAQLLSMDQCWRSVIRYCVDKGTFIGVEPL